MYTLKKAEGENARGYVYEVQLPGGESTGVEIHPGSIHPAGGTYADFVGEDAAPQKLRDVATFFVDQYGSGFNFENADHYVDGQVEG